MAAKASDVPAKTSAVPAPAATAPAATATAGVGLERQKWNEEEQHRRHANAGRHDRPHDISASIWTRCR
jgi:hypothetical protein